MSQENSSVVGREEWRLRLVMIIVLFLCRYRMSLMTFSVTVLHILTDI